MNRKVTRKRKEVNTHISLQAIKDYLQHGTYPKCHPKTIKRSIRKRAESFKIYEGELYYIARPKHLDDEEPDPKPEIDKDNYRKVIMTVREQLALTTRIHVSDTGVHKGSERTLNAITPHYYWVGMSNTVRQVIKHCGVCLLNRPNLTFQAAFSAHAIPDTSSAQPSNGHDETYTVCDGKENEVDMDNGSALTDTAKVTYTVTSELEKPEEEDPDLDFDASNVFNDNDDLMQQSEILNAQQFWERVEIQIISPSDEKKKKKNEDGRRKRKPFIIVALDSYSKWPEAKKIDKVNEQTVSQFIIQLIVRFGIMNRLVILDNGITCEQSLVASGIMQNLSSFNIIVMSESSNPYDDHWNRVSSCVGNFVEKYPESWSSCLDLCLMPLRNSVSPRTDYTPAYLAMGREPTFPNVLFPNKDSSDAEIMLNPNQIGLTIDNIMGKYHECCEADVKEIITPLESIPLSIKKAVAVKEELTGVRRSGRKVTMSSRLFDFDGVFYPAGDHEDCSFPGDGDDTYSCSDDITKEGGIVKSSAHKKIKDTHGAEEISSPLESTNTNETNDNDCPGVRISISRRKVDGEDVLDKIEIGIFYEILKQYIEKGTYPLNCTVTFKRIIRKAREMHFMEDGKLMYKHRGKNKTVPITLKERLQLLYEIHTLTPDHLPRNKMLDELDCRMLYWKAYCTDVEAFVKACPDCKCGKTRPRQTKGKFAKKMWLKDSDSEDELSEKCPDEIISYPDLIEFLKNGTQPGNMTRADLVIFKKKAKDFRLIDDELHYAPLARSKMKPRKVLMTEKDRYDAMMESHGTSHRSAIVMLTNLRKIYYWRPMKNEIEKFVISCCQPETDMNGEKYEELSRRIDLYRKYFQGHDICSEVVDLDSLFTARTENSGLTVMDPEVSDPLSESLDERTGQLRKHGQAQVQRDTGFTRELPLDKHKDVGSKVAQESTEKNDENYKEDVTKENVSEAVDEDKDQRLLQTSNAESLQGDIEMDNPYLLVRKRGVKMRCEVCKKLIRGENNYKEHMYKHTGIKPFTCQVCSKKFTSVKGMRLHMRKHTGHRPYLCNVCGRGFPRSASLRYHIKTHESGGPVPVICDICNRIFTSEHRLKKHKRFKHPAQMPVFKCDTCGKHFTAQRSLKRHQEAHLGIRRYMCHFCKRSFFRKEYLTYHLDSHYRDNPSMSHLASKRKFRRRTGQRQQVDKDENTILSILTVEPDMGQEEVYTQLVEVTNPQGWTEGNTALHEGHSIPAVFSLDGTIQVSEVVNQIDAGPSITMVEDHTTTTDQGIETHHIIVPNPQIDSSDQKLQMKKNDKDNDGQKMEKHEQETNVTAEESRHFEVTLTNGQKLTLSRTGKIVVGEQGQETVQYHVECLSGDTLTESDLNAIRLLAQSSVLQQ